MQEGVILEQVVVLVEREIGEELPELGSAWPVTIRQVRRGRADRPDTGARSGSARARRRRVGSSVARAYASTSTTSGRWISPARFTNSAGTSIAPNASCSASNSRCVRHRTAMSLHATPSAWSACARSATPSASATSCSYRATSTCPSPLRSHGRSSLSGSGRWLAGSASITRSAACEDPGARAEVRVQRELRGLGPVGERELRAEVQQVPQARAAPGVDVLVGIADRRHRVALPEHGAHQDRLRVVRVLVLVEQDGAEPVCGRPRPPPGAPTRSGRRARSDRRSRSRRAPP